MILSFLIGAIPFGEIIARLKKINLREVGSGNIGATNVYRALGLRWAFLVFLLDALKGAGSVLLSYKFLGKDYLIGLSGILAVLGHIFSPYLRFKGGKGVACGFGVMIVLAPVASLLVFLLWVVMVLLSRIVSLSSLISAILLPFIVWALGGKKEYILAGAIIGFLVLISHRANISRLIKRKEPRIKSISLPSKKRK